MPPLYARYILKALLTPFVVTALTLTGVVMLTQSLRFVELIVDKGLSAGMFLYLTGLLIPSLSLVILPAAAFIACAFVYSRLLSDSELTALSGAGVSGFKMAAPGAILGLLVAALLFVVTLAALPYSYRTFKDMQYLIRNRYASLLLQEGVFNTPAEGVTVYVNEFDPSGKMKEIFVYDARDPDTQAGMTAKEGFLTYTDKGPRFTLINGARQERDAKRGSSSLLYFDLYDLDVAAYNKEAYRAWREAEEYYVPELKTMLKDAALPERLRGKLTAELHFRFLWPAFGFLLACAPLPWLLTGELDRRGKWRRLSVAAIAATAAAAGQLGVKSFIVSHPALYWTGYAYLVILFVPAVTAFFAPGIRLGKVSPPGSDDRPVSA